MNDQRQSVHRLSRHIVAPTSLCALLTNIKQQGIEIIHRPNGKVSIAWMILIRIEFSGHPCAKMIRYEVCSCLGIIKIYWNTLRVFDWQWVSTYGWLLIIQSRVPFRRVPDRTQNIIFYEWIESKNRLRNGIQLVIFWVLTAVAELFTRWAKRRFFDKCCDNHKLFHYFRSYLMHFVFVFTLITRIAWITWTWIPDTY